MAKQQSLKQFHYITKTTFKDAKTGHIAVSRHFHQHFTNEKGASKMLMKLTSGVTFINILGAAFAPIFFCQKNYEAKT